MIEINNVTKIYKLYNKPVDRLKEIIFPFKKFHKDFFALKNISFKINRGETVGIIGKNGSGKSTLLKIISGIIKPTKGKIKVDGRISSLLELGTGFHPELNGIENIYLYGSVMGISKKNMKQKINDIVDFADIGDFIYRPVKTYSSGMYSRLAFAVAINIEPEILIVDEVLSVGDIAFQYKCFEKFKEFKKKGVTILFVTHSMGQILNNCNRAILLNNGELIDDSYDVKGVVAEYEKIIRGAKKVSNTKKEVNKEILSLNLDKSPNKALQEKRFGSQKAIIADLKISYKRDFIKDEEILESGREVFFNFLIYSYENLDKIVLGVSIRNKNTQDIWGDNNLFATGKLFTLTKGLNKISYKFKLNINSGEYLVFAGLARLDSVREEIDQRWPIKKISVFSSRRQVGFLYSPIEIIKD